MELKSKRDRLQVGLLLLPGLLVFALFTVYPIGKLLYMSFLQWDLGSMQHQKFIGLQNYIDVLSDKTFRIAFANTLIYTLVTVPGQMILGLLAAVLINAIPRFRVTFRVIYYIPVITSWVIVSLIFRYIFNTEGMLNYVLTNALHLTASNIRWLDGRWGGLTVAMMLGIWKGVGWNLVVFLAALQSVPQELYESAGIDGCGAFQKFFYVTLPSIKPTILFALVMLTIGGFNVFTSIKMITGGKPMHQTETVLTWMYYKAFNTGSFGYAAALSFVVAVTLIFLAILQFKAMKQKDVGGTAMHTLKKRELPSNILRYVLLLLGGAVSVMPMIYMISTSLKPNGALYEFPPKFFPALDTVTLENYVYIFSQEKFYVNFLNSAIVAILTVVIAAFVSSALAFCLARFRFPGRRALFGLVIGTMIIPGTTLIITQYQLASFFKLTNKLLGLVPFYVAWVIPFSTFMIKGYIESIPREFDEAVYMDGGSVFTVFFKVICPLASPAIASVSIFNFLTAWEEFPWALTVLNDTQKRTLPIAISGFFGQHQFTQWGYVFAMSVASLLPVLIIFICCQKYFVSGLQTGGIKG